MNCIDANCREADPIYKTEKWKVCSKRSGSWSALDCNANDDEWLCMIF